MPTIHTSNEACEIQLTVNPGWGKNKNEIFFLSTLILNKFINKEDRKKMKDYWVKHSQFANIQEMLLDSNAQEISDNEMPEMMSLLPSFKSKRVLELGAGIGRFTRVLAQQAEHVTAVDFIEKFLERSRELNSDLNNIDYLASDVMKLDFERNT